VKGSEAGVYRLLVCSAPFCSMRFINDARSLPTETGTITRSGRHNNVYFRDACEVNSRQDYRCTDLITIVAKENI